MGRQEWEGAVKGEEAKEVPQRGDLFCLAHPGTPELFSGYGLVEEAGRKGRLVGLLMWTAPDRWTPPGWRMSRQRLEEAKQISPLSRDSL